MKDADELRDIPGYPGYRVTCDGRVWGKSAWRKLQVDDSGGHLWFSTSINGRKKNLMVHQAVLFAWIGARPEGMQACHDDGDPTNNSVANLRWDTAAANMADRIRHGTIVRGESHGNAKLTEDHVREIRDLVENPILTTTMIGELFGVNRRVVSSIKHGDSWGWLR